jgi:methyl-accepting chemotaxis protein
VRVIHKLFAAAGLGILGLVTVVGITYVSLNSLGEDVHTLAESDLPANALLLNIDRDAYQAELGLERFVLEDDADHAASYYEDYTSNAAQTEERFLLYEDIAVGLEGEAAEGDAYWEARTAWLASADELVAMRQSGLEAADPAIQEHVDQTSALFDSMRDHIDVIYGLYEVRAADFGPAVTGHLDGINQNMVVLLALTIVVSLAAIWVIGRRVEKPLKLVTEAAEAIAVGDVTTDVTHTSRDETGALADAFRDLTEYLRQAAAVATQVADGDLTATITPRSDDDRLGVALADMIRRLRVVVGDATNVTRQVGAGSATLAQSSQESAQAAADVADSIGSVADGATNQSAIAESLAAAVAQIGDEIRATTEIYRDVVAASEDAETKAGDGAERLSQAIGAMEKVTSVFAAAATTVAELGEHSERVEEIVDLIRSIADQTNLLALNAAIEAARAGEMGRGFAVVASEVKSLAEESSQSTEQIAEIVAQMRDSISGAITVMDTGRNEVDAGSETVTTAGESFAAINDAVRTIAAKVSIASESTNQIQAATESINQGATELIEITESASAASSTVAASSEEAAATSEEIGATAQQLSASAKLLENAMARFRL